MVSIIAYNLLTSVKYKLGMNMSSHFVLHVINTSEKLTADSLMAECALQFERGKLNPT